MKDLLARQSFTGAALPDAVRALLNGKTPLNGDELVVSVEREVSVEEAQTRWHQRLAEVDAIHKREGIEV